MMFVLKVALFLLFSVHAAMAQEQPLPPPMTGKWDKGDFCISESLIIELLEESEGLETSPRKKRGCGVLFIPMKLTVTPIRRVALDFGDRVIVRISSTFGDEAFSYLEPPKYTELFPIGKEMMTQELPPP